MACSFFEPCAALGLNFFRMCVVCPRHKAARNFLCCFSCIMFRCFRHADFNEKPSHSIFFSALSWRSNVCQRPIGSQSWSGYISLRLCQVVFHELVRKCQASTLTLQNVVFGVCSSLHPITVKILEPLRCYCTQRTLEAPNRRKYWHNVAFQSFTMRRHLVLFFSKSQILEHQ